MQGPITTIQVAAQTMSAPVAKRRQRFEIMSSAAPTVTRMNGQSAPKKPGS